MRRILLEGLARGALTEPPPSADDAALAELAAKVDGASPWQLTRHITLPFIRGVLLVAGLFRLIDSIKAFPLIFILTDGGPGNLTEVTNYYSYLQAFNFSFLGFSSAITVALLAATIALSWLIVRMVGWGARID